MRTVFATLRFSSATIIDANACMTHAIFANSILVTVIQCQEHANPTYQEILSLKVASGECMPLAQSNWQGPKVETITWALNLNWSSMILLRKWALEYTNHQCCFLC